MRRLSKISKYILIIMMLFLTKDVYAETVNKKVEGASKNDAKFSLADAKYNLVTPTKDQRDTSSCWAFATNAAIESNLLMNDLGTFDLSEGHLEVATQNTYNNNRLTFNRTKENGGNFAIASAYLMNNWGPVNESVLTFDKYIQSLENKNVIHASDIINNTAIVDVNDIIFFGNTGACSDATKTDIKEYLLSFGAIAAYAYIPEGKQKDEYHFDTSSNAINHALTIIGWDDDLDKESFSDTKPTKNGGWLVKNSASTEKYQYVSYEDTHICNTLVGFSNVDKDVEDYAYYYDNLGANETKTSTASTLYLKSVFTKKSIANNEELKEVAMYLPKIGQKYEIYFANGDVSDITKMEKIADSNTYFVGYKTHELTTAKTISDKKFTIIVKFIGNENIQYEVSSKKSDGTYYNNIKFTSDVQYISTDGTNYTDVAKEASPSQLTIRAYTDKISSTPSTTTPTDNNTGSTTTPSNEVNKVPVGEGKDKSTNNPKTFGIYVPISLIVISLVPITMYLKHKNKKLYKI